jgi:undecaprenyl pyrophosphate phosphatase UppP
VAFYWVAHARSSRVFVFHGDTGDVWCQFIANHQFGLVFSSAEWMILGVGTALPLWPRSSHPFLMQYIRRNDFSVFGWYRILLGGAVLAISF